jgi:hypothetical protein
MKDGRVVISSHAGHTRNRHARNRAKHDLECAPSGYASGLMAFSEGYIFEWSRGASLVPVSLLENVACRLAGLFPITNDTMAGKPKRPDATTHTLNRQIKYLGDLGAGHARP